MHWILTTEQDPASDALGKRPWVAAHRFASHLVKQALESGKIFLMLPNRESYA